jgi:hypothetical protein
MAGEGGDSSEVRYTGVVLIKGVRCIVKEVVTDPFLKVSLLII